MPVEIDTPRQASHGDFMTNFAMVGSKALGKPPREVATALAEALQETGVFAGVEVAGPGFLNMTLSPTFVGSVLADMLARGESFAFAEPGSGEKINVEFVSVNPNGPITIGSGRGAAYGSALCNVLEAVGHTVHREYYINDGVNSEQMRLFAESVRYYLAEIAGLPDNEFPEKGYKGDYVQTAAFNLVSFAQDAEFCGKYGVTFVEYGRPELTSWNRRVAKEMLALSTPTLQILSQQSMTWWQGQNLTDFGVYFDTWFSEQSLHDSGQVAQDIATLENQGAADRRPSRTKIKFAKGGAVEAIEVEAQDAVKEDSDEGPGEGETETLWLRSTKFGDDMDRVLQRRDGRWTYISSDVAYHKDKFNRPPNADRLITVLGPDHHGYIGRLRAVLAALFMAEARVQPEPGPAELSETDSQLYANTAERDLCRAATTLAAQKLQVQIFQIVRFMKDGKPAPMRKRDGNIYALIDLIDEIGQKAKPNGTLEEQREAGKDVARFFYLMRHHDTAMDFDLDLAAKQSDDNPVYYVQYAHARICSVLDKAKEAGFEAPSPNPFPSSQANQGRGAEPSPQPSPWKGEGAGAALDHPAEKALAIMVGELQNEIAISAKDSSVNRLTTYAVELARTYHTFYDQCRVVQPEEPATTQKRVELSVAARNALRATFKLLGISAPERMSRD